MFQPTDKYQLKYFGATLPPTNYYNQYHKIIRVNFDDRFYDFRYAGDVLVPNPQKHVAIILTAEEFISETGLSNERLDLLPGLADEQGNPAKLPFGWVQVMPFHLSSSSTKPNSGGSAFAVQRLDLNLEKVAIAISPPTDKHYTSTDMAYDRQAGSEGQEELEDRNFGIFMNYDGSILIKSAGGSITLGEEGVYIAGNVGWESSEHQREWMMDNFLQRFIPSTIPTGAVAIPELPNIAKFAQIAEAGRKVFDISSKVGSISNLLRN